MKEYFLETWDKEYLVKIEGNGDHIEKIERYDFDKKQWIDDFRATKLFGKMCIGSIDVDVISEEEVNDLISKEIRIYN